MLTVKTVKLLLVLEEKITMKRIMLPLVFLSVFFMSPAVNSEELVSFSSLCIPTANTGFNLEEGKWIYTKFKTEKFFLKKIAAVPEKPEINYVDASPDEFKAQSQKQSDWYRVYDSCIELRNKKPSIGELTNIYPACVLVKNFSEKEWEGYKCSEMYFKEGRHQGERRISCKSYLSEIKFFPDGNYLKTHSHANIFDSVKDTDSQSIEMGRCSVISDE